MPDNNTLSVNGDEVEKSASTITSESENISPTDETTLTSADEKFGAFASEADDETKRKIDATRKIADDLTNTSRDIETEDTAAAEKAAKVDPSAKTQLSTASSPTAATTTSDNPRDIAAMLDAQRQQHEQESVQQQQMAQQQEQQQRQQQMAQQRAAQETAARNQQQYQQYLQQQQRLAQQQAQQQQLVYNQQQQALAMQQQQQQSALLAQQQAQALENQGQNVQTITNSDGGYLIDKDDLAQIIEEAQNSRAGDASIGSESEGDYRGDSTSGGQAPFTLGEPIDKGVLDISEVTYEKDPENATLTDEELDGVINDALDANGVTDDPEVRGKWIEIMKYIQENESNSVVNAANGWDSNAWGPEQSDSYPLHSSRGMWQCIPDTFAARHVEGTSTSIYDPTASCAASVNYLISSYNFDPETGAGIDEFYNDRYPTYKGY